MGEVAASYVSIIPKISDNFGKQLETQMRKQSAGAFGPIDAEGKKAGAKAAGTFGASFKRVAGPMLALASVGSIATFVKGAVDSYAQLEDATAAAGVTFGASMDLIQAKAAGASSSLGISKQQYIDGALTMGTFGKSAGLAGEDLANFSNGLVQTAGDMASFRGTTPEQAIEAVGSALRGEMEPIRQYGVMLDDATLRSEAMRMGLIKTTKEALTPANKVLAVQSLILAKTSDAQGDFARTSDSTANVQKRLKAETENFNAALGQKLAPTIVEVQEGLSNLMGTAEDNNAVLGPLTDTARGLATAFNDVTRAMDGGTEAGKALKPFLDQLNIITGIKPLQDLANAYVGWSGSADDATTAAKDNESATKGSTGATRGNTAATNTNSDALKTNAEKVNDLVTARLKLRGDKRSLEGAIDDATKSVKENGKTLDINTEKGRNNQAALDGIAAAGLTVGGNMNKSYTAFVKAAKAMGMSDDAARRLAKSLGLIKSKKVTITASVAMNKAKDEVQYSVAGHGTVKFTARRTGGPIKANEPYWVGEDGPEPFFPNMDGRMLSTDQAKSALSGAGAGKSDLPPIQLNVHGQNADDVAARAVARLQHVLADRADQ